jgi:tRNA-specific adenosine deaminase 3
MCSMALVHSRVSRVFFAEPSPTNGGLYSVGRLQNITSLNHSFQVYKVDTTEKNE